MGVGNLRHVLAGFGFGQAENSWKRAVGFLMKRKVLLFSYQLTSRSSAMGLLAPDPPGLLEPHCLVLAL